jgi:hypothetical protein
MIHNPQTPNEVWPVFIGKINIKPINIKTFTTIDIPNIESITFYIGIVAHAHSFIMLFFVAHLAHYSV